MGTELPESTDSQEQRSLPPSPLGTRVVRGKNSFPRVFPTWSWVTSGFAVVRYRRWRKTRIVRVWEMRAGVGDDIEPWRRRLVVPSVCQAARNVGAVGIDLGLVKNRSVEASNPGGVVGIDLRQALHRIAGVTPRFTAPGLSVVLRARRRNEDRSWQGRRDRGMEGRQNLFSFLALPIMCGPCSRHPAPL